MTVGVVGARRIAARATRKAVYSLCEHLKNGLSFEHISCVTGVDKVDHLEVVYHVSSYANGCMIEVTVDVPIDDAEVDSVTAIWEGANWHEREAFELFGIRFKNHPKLERLLLPSDLGYYPFRKEFKLRGR
ncbi:MAG: NADH-quinone oxidoreductase subunit C [Methanomassiliicoccales archaeon]|nr:NADH-quinone oxidoreductase subunit C [Methanomassiliicoccales archaeon]